MLRYSCNEKVCTVAELKVDSWKLLHVFDNKVRVEIVKLLLQLEWRSLSDIAEKLEANHGWKMTLPGVLKHMKELENAGIIRHVSGVYAKKPDARKTIYLLEGKERVKKILKQLENSILDPLEAGLTYNKTAEMARKVQGLGSRLDREEKRRLETLLSQCESERVYAHLTEDEKKKLKLWRMMIKLLEE